MAKIAVLLADGFEEIEGLTVVDVCRRARLELDMISIMGREEVVSSHSIPVRTDGLLENVNPDDYDMLVLPGGLKGTQNLENCEMLMKALDAFYAQEDKWLAAICAAPSIFGHRGYLKGRAATSYPTFESHLEGAITKGAGVEVDGHIITGCSMAFSLDFALAIVEQLAGKELADKVASDIVYSR